MSTRFFGGNTMKLMRASRPVLVAVMTAVLSMTALPAHAVTTYKATPSQGWYVPNGRVYAIATDATRVYIGGTFKSVKNPADNKVVLRAGLAAFDKTTGALDTTWNPGALTATGAVGKVRALTVENGVVYVGGLFARAGGATATNVAALDGATGQPVPGFSTSTTGSTSAAGEVRDLAVVPNGVSNDLFVAGSFAKVNGTARVGLAKVDAATGVVSTGFNARVGGGRVMALSEDPDRGQLIIGGNFKTLAGTARLFLGAVSYTTGANTGWAPQHVCDSCNVLDLDAEGSEVFAATAGGGGGRAAAYKTTSNVRTWVKHGDGDVQAVDYFDGTVYVGGHFGVAFDNVPRQQFAALDSVSGAVQVYAIPFTGLPDPGVWAVKADASSLRVGGGFQGVSGSSTSRYAVFPATAG